MIFENGEFIIGPIRIRTIFTGSRQKPILSQVQPQLAPYLATTRPVGGRLTISTRVILQSIQKNNLQKLCPQKSHIVLKAMTSQLSSQQLFLNL